MNNLVIREGRLLLMQSVQKDKCLNWKLCIGTKIYKFQNFIWSSVCKRWEINKEMKVCWSQEASIQLQIFYQNNGFIKVLGESMIDMDIFKEHFNQEIKLALTYQGIITGWLYLTMGLQGQARQTESKFLYIYKINFFFLEEEDQSFKFQIFQNTLPIYQKQFTLFHKGKTIFPNLKKPIQYSDHSKKPLKNISFLVDNIKRGKSTHFEAWLRNKYNNKIGDLKLQYFLQNLFLQNDRKLVSRKGLYNASYLAQSQVLKFSNIQNISQSQTRQESKQAPLRPKQTFSHEQTNQIKIRHKKNYEKQKSIKFQGQIKLQKHQVSNLTQQSKQNERAIACLRQTKTNIKVSKSKLISRSQKKQFYFQNPFQN